MDLARFPEVFERTLETSAAARYTNAWPLNRIARKWFDPCPDVTGMASWRKLKLMGLIASLMPADGSECYLEVGTYQGKSLVATLLGNPKLRAIACDDFSEYDPQGNNVRALEANLKNHGLQDRVQFFNMDFRKLLSSWRERGLPTVGAYFYDGAHDQASQREGIAMAEPLLADRAIVVVDDWRLAKDSGSYAEAGTMEAIAASPNRWKLIRSLPARFNGDRDQWWNGVAVFSFERKQA